MKIAGFIKFIGVLLLALSTTVSAQPRDPESVLGFRVGTDYTLAGWTQIVDYFRGLDEESDRVVLETLGESTNGRPFVMAVISSEENLANLDAIKADQRKLADPRLLAEGDLDAILDRGKTVVLIGCNIHATEIASSQMSMELAHSLATAEDDVTRRIREDVVVLLVPSLNPDGIDIVRDWYNETLGTPWEGSRPPWLYHPYTGHDNNRDWFMLSQVETQIMTRVLYHAWYPQIVYDVHQMGNKGARFFVPPFFDPLNPNVPPLLQRQIMLIGAHMAHDLQAARKPGVITSAVYDMWWHGGFRSVPYRHNTVGLLTEAASVNIATPIFQKVTELDGHRRGLPKYWLQANFPQPWQGGWWRLRDIVDYELIAARSLLKLASTHRVDWLRNQVELGNRSIQLGKDEPPYAFIVPADQHDPVATYEMLRILDEGGVEIHRANAAFSADGVDYARGTHIVMMSQPYRSHAKDLLERQRYPDRRIGDDDGPPERPYDVTGWTLPLQMGVRTIEVVEPFEVDAEPVEPALPSHRAPSSDDGFYLANRTNHDVQAVNQLLGKGFGAFWIPETVRAGSERIGPGAVYVPSRNGLRAEAARMVRELGIQPLSGKKPARGYRLKTPRLGLYQPWTSNMDEGWTRWVLERYDFDYRTIHDAEVRAGNLNDRYDVIVLPSIGTRSLLEGNAPSVRPPRFQGGIGDQGADALIAFVNNGGTLVCMGNASRFGIERFDTGAEEVEAGDDNAEPFYAPGSILQVTIDETHPLVYGRRSPMPVYFAQSPVFETSGSATSVASYPGFNPLMSGWIHGDDMIHGRTALVDAPVGKGRVILFGFRPQHRAQPHVTFKVLFNAIHYGVAQPNARVN